MLRTRRMGGQAFVDVHVQVSPKLSVSEGHQIADFARARLLEQVDEVTDVTVHIDPEDDEDSALNWDLPGRKDVLDQLYSRLEPIVDRQQIQEVTLHYLMGRIDVDLVLPLHIATTESSPLALVQRITDATRASERIRSVRVRFG